MNVRWRLVRHALWFAAVAALALAALGVAGSSAEGADTASAAIHSGSCAALGAVVAPLQALAPPTSAAPAGAPSALPVAMSMTEVDLPLAAMLASPHAIVVQVGADASRDYAVCGDVGGALSDEGDELVVGLGAPAGSGASGIAMLDADDARTEVTLYLVGTSGAFGADAARATPAAPSLSVAIKGFAYVPAAIEIPAGGSVTWTNEDNAPHTVTGVDGAIPNSKGLGFGQTFTQEFDTPGTYPYYCVYHPGMKGTVVVK